MDEAKAAADLSASSPALRAAAFRRLYALGERRGRRALALLARDPALRSLLAFRKRPLEAVGVAVRPAAYARIRTRWGVKRDTPVPAARRTREFSIALRGRRLDVLRPAGRGGPIARFLARRGEGIQHVELGVRDAGGAAERLVRLADPRLKGIGAGPVRGADGRRVYFVLVDVSSKTRKQRVLTELAET